MSKTKLNHIFIVQIRFCARIATKNETKNVNKNKLLFNFCNIFDLLTSRTQKIAWWPPVYRPGFFIFSYNEQEILKKFHRQVFIVSNLKLHCYLAKFYLDHLGFWRNNQKYSLQFTVMSMMNFQILRFLDSSKATQKSKCYEQEPYFSQVKHSFIMH